jgi:hypothetical protein
MGEEQHVQAGLHGVDGIALQRIRGEARGVYVLGDAYSAHEAFGSVGHGAAISSKISVGGGVIR